MEKDEESKLAKKRLSEIDLSNDKIDKCLAMILATKQHLPSEDSDTNYLLDADLAILGKNPEDYQKYSNQIREEYTIYADFMYNSGRKKALQYFLEMEAIYKTEHFFKKYEEQARINIKNELDNLNH